MLSPGSSDADAMHDQARLQRPARIGLALDALQLASRSCRGSARASCAAIGLPPSSAAHRSGEGDDGADVGAALRQELDLGADVEVFAPARARSPG